MSSIKPKSFGKKIKQNKNLNKLSIYIILFAVIGVAMLVRSLAATPTAQFEAESSTLVGAVSPVSDTSASSGSAILFEAPVTTVTPGQMFITTAELNSKPTSGAGWDYLKSKADLASYGTVNLADIDSITQTHVLAAALVYARTGDEAYKTKAISYIKQACGTETDGSDQLLNLARTLYGYVVSADMVKMPLTTVCTNGETWQAFLQRIRTTTIPSNTTWPNLEITSQISANNWGAYALGSHLAVSYALNDTAAIERDTNIFKRFLGDTSSPAAAFKPSASYSFNNNGVTWDMTPTLNRGINPYSATDQREGAIINDALRLTSGGSDSVPCCTVQPAGVEYQEEALDGIFSTMQLLRAHGVDLRTSQNSAAKRAFDFYITNGGPSTDGSSMMRYLPYFVNYNYGTNYATVTENRVYRHMAYGSWLFTGPTP